jgi:hypothetical protein
MKDSPVAYSKTDFLKSNRIMIIDDMQAAHACFKLYIERYNKETNNNFEVCDFYSVAELVKNSNQHYICGFFDWNLSSTNIMERGDIAIEKTKTRCFKQCILTRMYDDQTIPVYAVKNGCWYISKGNDEDTYIKIKDYLNMVIKNLSS